MIVATNLLFRKMKYASSFFNAFSSNSFQLITSCSLKCDMLPSLHRAEISNPVRLLCLLSSMYGGNSEVNSAPSAYHHLPSLNSSLKPSNSPNAFTEPAYFRSNQAAYHKLAQSVQVQRRFCPNIHARHH